MSDSQVTAYLRANRQRHLDDLCTWLRIPSISTQPQHKADIEQVAATAYTQAFGATPIFGREGGSIGVAISFQTALKTPLIFLGFGLPHDDLHAPNEKMHLPNFYRGIEASVIFMQEVARQ